MVNLPPEILSYLIDIAKSENSKIFEIKYSDGFEKGDGLLSDIVDVKLFFFI